MRQRSWTGGHRRARPPKRPAPPSRRGLRGLRRGGHLRQSLGATVGVPISPSNNPHAKRRRRRRALSRARLDRRKLLRERVPLPPERLRGGRPAPERVRRLLLRAELPLQPPERLLALVLLLPRVDRLRRRRPRLRLELADLGRWWGVLFSLRCGGMVKCGLDRLEPCARGGGERRRARRREGARGRALARSASASRRAASSAFSARAASSCATNGSAHVCCTSASTGLE